MSSAPLIGELAADIETWFEQLQAHKGMTFSLKAQSKKFANEAEEFAAEPQDMSEAADVFISLVGTLWVQGLDVQDLAEAVSDKMEVLRKRTWAVADDGTYQHVRSCEECGNDDGPHTGPDGRPHCLDCLEKTA